MTRHRPRAWPYEGLSPNILFPRQVSKALASFDVPHAVNTLYVQVGARDISVLLDKLQALSPDAKAGILVALNGITGDSHSDAVLKIREGRQRGRYVLVLDRADLEEIVACGSLAQVIERKYEKMLLI